MNYQKQAFYNTVGNVVYLGCTWLLTVLVVRLSGFEDAGVLGLAMSVGNVFYFIGMYGMRSFQSSDATHQYSADVYRRTRWVTVGASLAMCAVYLGVSLLTGSLSGYSALAIFLYLIYRSFEAGSDVLFGELQKDGHLEVCGLSMSVKGVLSVGIFSLLIRPLGLNAALAGLCVLAGAIWLLYDRRRFRALHREPDSPAPGTLKGLLVQGFPLLLTTVFPIAVTALPRLALEHYQGEAMLGIYASICTPTVIITTLVPNILTPFMTLYGKLVAQKEYGKLVRYLLLSMALTAALGAVACLLAWPLADWALSLLYGEEILTHTYLFIPLIVATTVYALSMCGNSVLIPLRSSGALIACAGAALAVSAAVSYPLTRIWGMMGTVVAFGLPFLVQLVLQLICVGVIVGRRAKRNEQEVRHGT